MLLFPIVDHLNHMVDNLAVQVIQGYKIVFGSRLHPRSKTYCCAGPTTVLPRLGFGLWSLVDQQLLILTFLSDNVLTDFDFLKLSPLFEDCPGSLQLLLMEFFAIAHHLDQLSRRFEFHTKLFELLHDLSITASGLARLSSFTTTEADIWVGIVCLGCRIKNSDLDVRHQRMAMTGLPPFPMLVDGLQEVLGLLRQRLITRLLQLL